MGSSESKEEEEDKDARYVFDRNLIYFDDDGNIRHGLAPVVPPERQMRAIMEVDQVEEQDGSEWFLVDSAWIAAWLGYVHAAKGVCPAPGPCKNHRLIVWDDELKKWVGRPGILMATSSREGDYRRVTKETWLKFCEFYPGCEPTIKMIFHPDELNSVGQYPLETFEILDPPEPPLEPKKRRIFRLRKSVDSDEEKNDDVDTSLLTETRKDKPVLTNQPDSSTKRKTSMDGSPKVEYSAVPDTASERSNTERTSKLSQPKKTDAFYDDVFFGKD